MDAPLDPDLPLKHDRPVVGSVELLRGSASYTVSQRGAAGLVPNT
jgi:hypothetical protein